MKYRFTTLAIRLAASSGAALAPLAAWGQSLDDVAAGIGAGIGPIPAPRFDSAVLAGEAAGVRGTDEAGSEMRRAPLRLGAIALRPALALAAGADSNVFARPAGGGSAVATAMPSLALHTEPGRQTLDLAAAATLRRFARYRREDSDEYALVGRARFDLGARGGADLSAGYARLVEPRSSSGVADATEPAAYVRLSAALGGQVQLGRLALRPRLDFERLAFRPLSLAGGGRADQSFRDTRALRGELRADYALAGGAAVFASAAHEELDAARPQPARRRDARTDVALLGLAGALTPLVSGEIAAGWQGRAYRDPAYRDVHGPTVRLRLQWSPRPLVSVTAEAGRMFRNSGNPLVGSILTDSVTLGLWHDPLPVLRLYAAATLERGDFGDVSTRTRRVSARLQAQYRLTPALSLGGYLRLTRQSVRGAPLVGRFATVMAGLVLTARP